MHELIDHRARSFQYIRRVHAGQKHWLGTVAFATDDLAQPRLYDSSQVRAAAAHATRMPLITKQRAALVLRRHPRPALRVSQLARWFHLGVSLAAVLQLPSDASFVRAMLQLWEEYTYHVSRPADKAMHPQSARHASRAIRARTRSTKGGEDDTDLSSALIRRGGEVIYTTLLVTPVSHALSGTHILQCLAELAQRAYAKMREVCRDIRRDHAEVRSSRCAPCMAQVPFSAAVADAVAKIDGSFEEHVLRPAARQLNTATSDAVAASLARTDPLFGRMFAPAAGGTHKGQQPADDHH